MRLSASIFFLTLVVSGLAANAAPVIDSNPPPITVSPKSSGEPIFASVDNSVKNWSLRLGFFGGALTETNQSASETLYGLRYEFLRDPLSAWEAEVTLGKESFVHLVLGKKFYFPLEQVTLPYYKFAVGDLVDSTDGLGAIFNIKKIQAIAAVGLDDLFRLDQHLQFEIGVGYAIIGPQFEMSLGVAF